MKNYLIFALFALVLLFTGSTIINAEPENMGFHWWVGLLAVFSGVGCVIASTYAVFHQ